mmetsp:Transcript_16139/g.21348  ORF Transcript_16139/g.21348 Transcript_16139/m.21348 type:complete len:124 (-) Transcript_16139:421-792(-)|eukprot:CAMPEP_0117757234 /NCGR_PEP_ID=MMETSP0947-20121206/14598_1 /TAXON_ID=44440 /ORGANISM="Chattonella subsalsa, Strain CCMP2191" /LENGTH=123 /DNA_ID=CAMNT_0005577065 /DNA_START=93 /DNA_END=464 /DNA_ORIENTATION=-
MSWFRKSKPEESKSEFASDNSFQVDGGFDQGSGADFSSHDVSIPSSGGAPMSQNQLQELVQQEQQRALIQTVVAKLTEIAHDKCVGRPASSLSSSEQGCIHAVVSKYLDTSEFVLGRMMKQQR